jgi:hypothetical protein
MPRHFSPVPPLPPQLLPPETSSELINRHIKRFIANGGRQKSIALALDLESPNISNWRAGKEIPLPRVREFARAVGLSEQETQELVYVRLVEMHGAQGEFCLATAAQWARDTFEPVGDEATLLAMWRDAIAPAPWLLAGLLNRSDVAAKLRQVLSDVVQTELQALSAEAASP